MRTSKNVILSHVCEQIHLQEILKYTASNDLYWLLSNFYYSFILFLLEKNCY